MTNISQNWLSRIDSTSFEVAEIFTRGYDKKAHGSEIARMSKLPQKTASRKLDSLCESGLLKFTREGRNKVYFINRESSLTTPFFVLVENYKTIKFMAEYKELGLLFKELPCGALIFGSYSKGEDIESSDIDLIIISKIKKEINLEVFEKEFKRTINIINIEDLSKLDKNIRKKVINGIVLHGEI